MRAQADPEVYHRSGRSLTGSAECREASGCHHVTSRTLFDNRLLSCNIVIFLISCNSVHGFTVAASLCMGIMNSMIRRLYLQDVQQASRHSERIPVILS